MSSPLLAPRVRVQLSDGHSRELDIDLWLNEADEVDQRVLERASGPVLDVGCGPGRHVEALNLRSVDVLGVDLEPDFVAVALSTQRPVLLQSVFDPIPGGARWQCALILDGSIGIGGDPVILLSRVRDLLVPGGRALIETGAPDEPSEHAQMSIESSSGSGSWFDWATLSASDAEMVVHAAGFTLTELWEDSGRWFAQVDRR